MSNTCTHNTTNFLNMELSCFTYGYEVDVSKNMFPTDVLTLISVFSYDYEVNDMNTATHHTH